MYIEMIDLLRCPLEHEETWLVASFAKIEGRFIIEGRLGCPVCSAMYEIRDGVAEFSSSQRMSDVVSSDEDAAIRTAALLNLTRAGSIAVLCGEDASVANQVSEMTQARIIALNPLNAVEETELVAVVTCADRIPLATGSVDGIAIGMSANLVMDASRVLKPGGRIVAETSVDLGAAFNTLARDARNVVGEVVGPVIQIGRR